MRNTTITLGQATYTVSRQFSTQQRTCKELLRQLMEKKLAQERSIAPGNNDGV